MWAAQFYRSDASWNFISSGGAGTMGFGFPAAIGAQFARPKDIVVAVVGDGGFQMTLCELATAVVNKLPVIVLVLNNQDLNQVTWEQRVMVGDPEFEASQDVPAFNYAEYARQLGLQGIRVEHPDEVGPAWDRALGADRPVVLDVLTDPNVPPLPPHITIEQARKFAMSMVKGDPRAGGVILQTAKDMLSAVLPSR